MNFKRIGTRITILIGFIIFGIGWKIEDNIIFKTVFIVLGMFIVEMGFMFDYEIINKENSKLKTRGV